MSERTKAAEDFDHIRKRLAELQAERDSVERAKAEPESAAPYAGSPVMGWAELNAFVIKNWTLHELRAPAQFSPPQRVFWQALSEPMTFTIPAGTTSITTK